MRRIRHTDRGSRGFSIIEMMVAITVAAILIALALPNFRELAVRNTVTSINNQLVTTLQTARSEAVRRGRWVFVVSTNHDANWGTKGWQVVFDVDLDNKYNSAADDAIGTITVGAPVATGYSVCAKSTGSSGIGSDQIAVFDPTGALIQAQSFDINVNRPDGKTSMLQHITVSQAGQITSQRGGTTPAPTGC